MNVNITPKKLPISLSNFFSHKIKICNSKEHDIDDNNKIKNQKLFFFKSKNIKLNSCKSLSHRKFESFNIFSKTINQIKNNTIKITTNKLLDKIKNKNQKNIRLRKKILIEQNSENSNDGNEITLNNKLYLSQIFPKIINNSPQSVLNNNKKKISIFSSNINETRRIKNDYKKIFSSKTIELEEINKKLFNNLKIENTKREKYRNLIEKKFNLELNRCNSKDDIIKFSLSKQKQIKYSEKKDILLNFLKNEFKIIHPSFDYDHYKILNKGINIKTKEIKEKI